MANRASSRRQQHGYRPDPVANGTELLTHSAFAFAGPAQLLDAFHVLPLGFKAFRVPPCHFHSAESNPGKAGAITRVFAERVLATVLFS